jgi:hypothetical protein
MNNGEELTDYLCQFSGNENPFQRKFLAKIPYDKYVAQEALSLPKKPIIHVD